jgi:hypothetical protein
MLTPPSLKEIQELAKQALAENPEAIKRAAEVGGLAAAAAAAAVSNEAKGLTPDLNPSGLDQIADPETRAKFEIAERTYAELWERIGLTLPPLAEFAAAGVDIVQLAQTFEQMERDNLEPRIVISKPMPLAPDDSGSGDSWRELYAQLTKASIDGRLPNPRLKNYEDNGKGDGPGLYVNSDVYEQSQLILEQEIKRIEAGRTGSTIHPVDDSSNSPWTIAILPGTIKPQQPGIRHATNQGRHVSLSQYLALQAALIQTGEPPIDDKVDKTYFWSWMNETLSEGSWALCAEWYPDFRQVYVDGCGVGDPNADVGARFAVWG